MSNEFANKIFFNRATTIELLYIIIKIIIIIIIILIIIIIIWYAYLMLSELYRHDSETSLLKKMHLFHTLLKHACMCP